MSGIALKFKLEPHEIQEAMAEIRRRVGDLTPAFKIAADILKTSIVRNFDEGGRPRKWPVSGRVKMHGGKTLIKSGAGRSSIGTWAFADHVEVQSTAPYMAAHQIGIDKTVTVAAHVRKVKPGSRGKGSNETAKGKGMVRAHQRRMHIPKREFMAIQEEDRLRVRNALIEYITGGGK